MRCREVGARRGDAGIVSRAHVAVALGEQRVERARGLASPPSGRPGFGRWRPGGDVEMHPALGRGDEAVAGTARRDRAGDAAVATLLMSAILVSSSRVVARHSGRRQSGSCSAGRARAPVGGERLVVGEERRQLRAERDARGAGERRDVDQQIGRLLVGERQRIGQDEPALGIGVADLDGEALAARETSPGRKALPEIAFSTAGISTRRRTGSLASMIMRASAEHVRRAAHVLLHQQHAADGLEVEPAGVEAHALADQRHLGCAGLAPVQIDQPRRARSRGAADRVDQREVLLAAARRR